MLSIFAELLKIIMKMIGIFPMWVILSTHCKPQWAPPIQGTASSRLRQPKGALQVSADSSKKKKLRKIPQGRVCGAQNNAQVFYNANESIERRGHASATVMVEPGEKTGCSVNLAL